MAHWPKAIMPVTTRDEEVVKHYRRFLGQEDRIIRFSDIAEPAPDPIWVMEFHQADTWVYATVGASRKPMPDVSESTVDTGSHRIELVMYSMQSSDELIDLMMSLATYPFILNTYFGPGHTVAGQPGRGVVEGSSLTEILLTYPYFEEPDFGMIHHSDGSHTQVLMVVPIYLSERLYVRDNGYRALEELFEEREIDASDLWRAPVV